MAIAMPVAKFILLFTLWVEADSIFDQQLETLFKYISNLDSYSGAASLLEIIFPD